MAIFGGGSAGLTAAKVGRFFAEKRIALIDKQRLGGDCLYYGCVPSKALMRAVRNIFLPLKLKFNPRLVPCVPFTDPEIAHVGLTEAEAKQQGRDCTVVRYPYSLLEPAITDQDAAGLMKFLIDGKRRFLGCHIAGANAGELINELTLAMNNKLTVDDLIGSIHVYPTYSFGVPIALYDYVLNEHPQAIAKVGRFLSKLT